MRPLLWLGCVCVAFGLGAFRVLGDLSLWSGANLVIGAGALGAALVLWIRRLGSSAASTAGGGNVGRSVAVLVATSGVAVGAVALASASDLRFDWTFEGRYAIAPATLQACGGLPEPRELTLYYQPGDPRIRNTRLVLEEIARSCSARVRQRNLDESPEDEDRFGIGSSNSVVIEVGTDGNRWELVERPTEGALFEAFSYLRAPEQRPVLYFGVGAGEGDLERSDDIGFSGLRAALENEGYEPRPLPMAVMDAVPRDADAVVMLSPQRELRETAQRALREYLEAGGSLVAFLDPGRWSGLESVLAAFGIESPDVLLIDPDSGPVEGDPPGLSPIAYNYGEHAVTRGLDRNRHTFFRRARSFRLRRLDPNDKLAAVVFASGNSWLEADPSTLYDRSTPVPPPGTRFDYHPIVVTARAPRDGGEARIVAFADSEVASNRYLRTLYNLDLVVNAVHWAVRREPDITIRPKVAELVQFPVPLQSSLQALYGAGLMVPQVLLLLGGFMWLRGRGA